MGKIVITGACGLVGMNLLTWMHDEDFSKNNDITCIDKNSNNIKIAKKLYPEIRFFLADLSITGNWDQYFKNADTVIQLQAQIASAYADPYIKNNIDSVNNIIEVCRKYGIRHLIHASSSQALSIAKDHYTYTKRAGENAVHISGVPHTIFRPTLMYGCFDIKHLGFITSIMEKSPVLPIPGSGKYTRQPLYVKDFCRIIIKSIELGPDNKIHDIIGKEKIYFIDIMREIRKKKKMTRLFVNIPIPIFIRLLNLYAFIFRKRPFVPDQLRAMTIGDVFKTDDWEKKFGVKYTKLSDALSEIYDSPYYKYRKEMIQME
jgi:nucleoside-diphosphate-sugar epimerase